MRTKIKRSTLVAFLEGMGFTGVGKMTDERLLAKLQKSKKAASEDDAELSNEHEGAEKFLAAIQKDATIIDAVEIVDDDYQARSVSVGDCVQEFEDDAEVLTIKEAAVFLNRSKNTLRNWERTGKIKARRNGLNNYRVYSMKELKQLRAKLRGEIL